MTKPIYDIQVAFRINEPMEEDLLLICRTYGQTRADVMRALITAEADKLKGNPKLQQAIEQMKQIEEQLKGIKEQYQK